MTCNVTSSMFLCDYPLDSTSTMLQPWIVGVEHYETAQGKEMLSFIIINQCSFLYASPWIDG
mgnify:CR=1 FL=1